MSRLKVGIRGVGMAAPGLTSWADSQAVLKGEVRYSPEDMIRYIPTLLPPNESRRATAVGRLAFQSAEEAIGAINGEASQLASVFASSGGDTDIVSKICSALATPDRPVSPTQFHNSVHNAPAGYWSIATHSHGASSSLSAYDGSFAAGLIEAATLACCEGVDVLLVTYDVQVAEPLNAKRPIGSSFTSALILTADLSGAECHLQMEIAHEGQETSLDDVTLEALRLNNPAARALPLLRSLALGEAADITLPAVDGLYVTVQLEPA